MLFFCSRAILLQTPLVHWEASGCYNKNISKELCYSEVKSNFSSQLYSTVTQRTCTYIVRVNNGAESQLEEVHKYVLQSFFTQEFDKTESHALRLIKVYLKFRKKNYYYVIHKPVFRLVYERNHISVMY